jgi:hypothetical protein
VTAGAGLITISPRRFSFAWMDTHYHSAKIAGMDATSLPSMRRIGNFDDAFA